MTSNSELPQKSVSPLDNSGHSKDLQVKTEDQEVNNAIPRFETAAEAIESAIEIQVDEDQDAVEKQNQEQTELTPPKDSQLPNSRREAAEAQNNSHGLTPKKRLLIALKPRMTRAQVLSALLLGMLGFALVVQLQLSSKDDLAGLRQSELIGLLDEVTRRTDDLESEERRLNSLITELESGINTQEVAQEAAEQSVAVQGILSGRLPAQGPGVEIRISEGDTPIRAQTLFNVLEELRNAGAEAMEVNGVRLVSSSFFTQNEDGTVTVSGTALSAPYVWLAIGDPNTIAPALEIPGGAMPQVRSNDGSATVTQLEKVEVTAIANLRDPEHARPIELDK